MEFKHKTNIRRNPDPRTKLEENSTQEQHQKIKGSQKQDQYQKEL